MLRILLSHIILSYLYCLILTINLYSQNLYWGDLHTHSGLSFDSDCSTTELYSFAKNISNLNFIIVSEHDINSSETDWESSKELANANNDPGNFIALVGYEWTAMPGEAGGHRIVIYPDDKSVRFSAESGFSNTISELSPLVAAEKGIMIIAHPDEDNFHANLDYIDNSTQVGIEFIGVYSSIFEYYGNSNSFPFQVLNNSARDALIKGNTLGAIGSSDSHDCRPGLGGLTAILTDTLTRANIYNAIKERRVYATTGARIRLGFNTDNLLMGDVYLYSQKELPIRSPIFNINVKGTSELSEIQVIKNSEIVHSIKNIDSDTISTVFEDLYSIEENTYYYLKVIQKDDELAWSSPIFFRNVNDDKKSNRETGSVISAQYHAASTEITLKFLLEADKLIEISMYDILGRKVKNIITAYYNEGYYEISSGKMNISSGLYFIQMTGESIKSTAKILVLK